MRACKCPNCGANLKVTDDDREFMYCEYCGARIDLADRRTVHTEHIIDDAKIKNAENVSRIVNIFAAPVEERQRQKEFERQRQAEAERREYERQKQKEADRPMQKPLRTAVQLSPEAALSSVQSIRSLPALSSSCFSAAVWDLVPALPRHPPLHLLPNRQASLLSHNPQAVPFRQLLPPLKKPGSSFIR